MSVMGLLSMRIVPASGIRNPATRLSNVVLPPPDGPSSVRISPCATSNVASLSATTSPKRLLTPAICRKPAAARAGACVSPGSNVALSADIFNVENLAEAEERICDDQQRRSRHDIHDRHRRHRGIGIFPDVIVHRDGERLGALRGDE